MFFKSKAQRSPKTAKSAAVTNPYVLGAAGRKEWNDRYFNLAIAKRNWQIAFFCMAAVSVFMSVGITKMAVSSRVEPFVVETNQGMPYALHPLKPMSSDDTRLVNYAINQFITNVRTVIADPKAQEKLVDRAYAFSADNALDYLKAYYRTNDPYAGDYTRSIQIVNAQQLSSHTWQVTWDETTTYTNTTKSPTTKRWQANVTYQFYTVNPDFVNENPFGLYITDLSWAADQTNNGADVAPGSQVNQ